MFDPNSPCLFCNSTQSGSTAENELAYASYDTYPVSEFHCLIIPKRHAKDYFDLNDDEVIACNNLIKQIKEQILLIEGEIDKPTSAAKGRCRSAANKIKKLSADFKRNHK